MKRITFMLLGLFLVSSHFCATDALAWCCGGGGGLVAEPELDEFRIKTGELKVEQIRNTGAKIVVSPCENCRLQLDTLNEKYDMGVKITSMMDLVVDNMQFTDEKRGSVKKTRKVKK